VLRQHISVDIYIIYITKLYFRK